MRLLDAIFAARPLMLVPVWTVYLLSLHYHLELSGESFSRNDIIIPGIFSALMAGACLLANSENRGNPVASNLSGRGAAAGHLLLSLLGLGAAALVSWSTLAIAVQMFLIGYFFSQRPLLLQRRSAAGLILVAYGAGLLVSIGPMPDITLHNAGLLGWDNPFYFFMAAMSLYLMGSLATMGEKPDSPGASLARSLGPVWTRLAAFGFMTVAAGIAYRNGHVGLLYLGMLSSFPLLITLVLGHRRADRFAARLPAILATLWAGYLFPVYLGILVAVLIVTRLYYVRKFGLAYPTV